MVRGLEHLTAQVFHVAEGFRVLFFESRVLSVQCTDVVLLLSYLGLLLVYVSLLLVDVVLLLLDLCICLCKRGFLLDADLFSSCQLCAQQVKIFLQTLVHGPLAVVLSV